MIAPLVMTVGALPNPVVDVKVVTGAVPPNVYVVFVTPPVVTTVGAAFPNPPDVYVLEVTTGAFPVGNVPVLLLPITVVDCAFGKPPVTPYGTGFNNRLSAVLQRPGYFELTPV